MDEVQYLLPSTLRTIRIITEETEVGLLILINNLILKFMALSFMSRATKDSSASVRHYKKCTQGILLKTMVLLICILLLGCNYKPKVQISKVDKASMKDTLESETKSEVTSIVRVKDVFPDTTINGRFHLGNFTSSKEFYPRIDEVKLIERIRDSPVALFSNQKGDEYLIAYQYEGGTKNAFSCFEIGYRKDLPNQVLNKTPEKSFKTESNIGLGMILQDVESIKGKNYLKKITNDSTMVIIYRINDMDLSPFLSRYNMPGYFLELTLKNDQVTKAFFGFDYP